MNFRAILGASICLNVVLIIVGLSDRRPIAAPETLAPAGSIREVILNPGESSPARSARNDPLPWNGIQSDDLPTYVFNLRAAGFPEPLVQRIIVAELDRRLAAQKRSTPWETNYWRTGPQRDEAERERREMRQALASEREAKLKELLGNSWQNAFAMMPGDALWVMLYLTGVSGDVEAEKLNRLSRVWPKVFGGFRDVSESGLTLPGSEARRRQAYDQAMAELREVLGPSGFEEFELRAMAMDVTDVWGSERLFGCIMTGAEFREFLRIKKETTLPLHDQFGLKIPEPTLEQTGTIDERIRALFGEERFKGYQRAKDAQFRWIRGASNDETMELSWAVYDIYAGLKDASSRIHDQIGLTDRERQAALRTLRTATERSLELTMGPEKFATHMEKSRGSFGWLDELTVKNAIQK